MFRRSNSRSAPVGVQRAPRSDTGAVFRRILLVLAVVGRDARDLTDPVAGVHQRHRARRKRRQLSRRSLCQRHKRHEPVDVALQRVERPERHHPEWTHRDPQERQVPRHRGAIEKVGYARTDLGLPERSAASVDRQGRRLDLQQLHGQVSRRLRWKHLDQGQGPDLELQRNQGTAVVQLQLAILDHLRRAALYPHLPARPVGE